MNAVRIAKDFGFTHLSTGDLLRDAVQSGSAERLCRGRAAPGDDAERAARLPGDRSGSAARGDALRHLREEEQPVPGGRLPAGAAAGGPLRKRGTL